ncbi:MAG TPA: histidine phosphatase family protein [Candidatus Acidoferrales bacterium]|jgi:broad specificity phosphatase PhoE
MASEEAIGPQMCRIVLVRHALAGGDGRFQGQLDVPLTAKGRRQLSNLTGKLSRYPIRAVYSSDLRRAQATAEATARKLGVKLEMRSGLREMHFGSWQGMSWKQIARRHPRLSALWITRFPRQQIPGAECFDKFVRRVRNEMRELIAVSQGLCVLAVTHAGVIRVALATALGMQVRNLFRLALDPCSISVIDYFREGVVVRCING